MEEPRPGTNASPQQGIPPVASHHERLLNEVEASDGQLGAILRSVGLLLARVSLFKL